MILFKVLTKKLVKGGSSYFQSFLVNSNKFHALCFTWLSQLAYTITNFVQDGFQKCSQVYIKCREWLELWRFLEWYRKKCWISQSCCITNRRWSLGFICEWWIQRVVKAVYAHIFTKQAKKSLNKHMPESWWLQLPGTWNEHRWWNSCNKGL
jgi:hypothetical protein